uniref:RNA replicase n=1 Tax=Hubei noda-like virus 13 TaxID=1922969 RepID=A0A1L3KG23_9VIRU|nr:hypothetical protein [Hubei noda-like virus 13]
MCQVIIDEIAKLPRCCAYPIPKVGVHPVEKQAIAWGLAAAVVGLGGFYLAKRYWRRGCSKLCDSLKTPINPDVRESFHSRFVFSYSGAREAEHSHPTAAALRTDAERSIDDWILQIGRQPYSVSKSARDDCGERLYYVPKDLDLKCTSDKVGPSSVIRMIDVDYYADMERWLWTGCPVVAYTFAPDTVGGSIVDGSFCIDDDHVVASFNGGAEYRHKLWDYNCDHIVVKGFIRSLLVKVDQVRIPQDPTRRVVLLTPVTWYFSVFNSILFDEVPTLRRRKFTYGTANVSVYQRRDLVDRAHVTKVFVSVSYVSTPTAVETEFGIFQAIQLRLTNSKHPNISDVERYLEHSKVTSAKALAPILFDAWQGGWVGVKYKQLGKQADSGVARTTLRAPHFQISQGLLNEDGEDYAVVVGEPVVLGAAVFPRRSRNNDDQAVEGRINSIRNEVVPRGQYRKYAKEFIKAFPLGQYSPWEISDVIEKQSRPTQRMRNERGISWFGQENFLVKAFMKKESYAKVTDPRNISTCTVSHTVLLSSYTYAAKEEFKKYNWFVPGRTPIQIAEGVQDFVMPVGWVTENDFSRLDGTISEFLRGVERGVYLRLFKPEFKPKLAKLLDDEIRCRATTATGTKYDPGWSRLSGSPLTTDSNTLLVGFYFYCAAREAKIIQEGDLHAIPALIYGDDSVSKLLTEKLLTRVAKDLGLSLKCSVVARGKSVQFLARKFVDPWTTTSSVQDPLRALGKIHLSAISDVDKELVLLNKVKGYLVTDPYTPIMSEYCTYYADRYKHLEKRLSDKRLERERSFWVAEYGEESGAWPQQSCDVGLMEQEVAKSLEISVDDLRQRCERYKTGDFSEPLQRVLRIDVPAAVSDERGNITLERRCPSA